MEEDVVPGTGIMVRTSASEDELELVAICEVFEKGTLRGRILGSPRRTSPAELRTASKKIPETICDLIMIATISKLNLNCSGFESWSQRQTRVRLKI